MYILSGLRVCVSMLQERDSIVAENVRLVESVGELTAEVHRLTNLLKCNQCIGCAMGVPTGNVTIEEIDTIMGK